MCDGFNLCIKLIWYALLELCKDQNNGLTTVFINEKKINKLIISLDVSYQTFESVRMIRVKYHNKKIREIVFRPTSFVREE